MSSLWAGVVRAAAADPSCLGCRVGVELERLGHAASQEASPRQGAGAVAAADGVARFDHPPAAPFLALGQGQLVRGHQMTRGHPEEADADPLHLGAGQGGRGLPDDLALIRGRWQRTLAGDAW